MSHIFRSYSLASSLSISEVEVYVRFIKDTTFDGYIPVAHVHQMLLKLLSN